MTVKELIDILKEFPPDFEVELWNDDRVEAEPIR